VILQRLATIGHQLRQKFVYQRSELRE
jgi:hypothetical protein